MAEWDAAGLRWTQRDWFPGPWRADLGHSEFTAPLKPLPEPVDLEQYRVRRHVRVSGMINEYRLVA